MTDPAYSYLRALYRNYRAVQAAGDSRIHHAWLRNSVACAFERMHADGTWGRGEAWNAVHVLHGYGITRYHYLYGDDFLLPSFP